MRKHWKTENGNVFSSTLTDRLLSNYALAGKLFYQTCSDNLSAKKHVLHPKNSNWCYMWYNFSHLIASLGHDKIVASNCGTNPRMSSRGEAARGGQFVWNVVAFLVKFVRNIVVVVVVAVVVACWHMCPQMSRAIAPTVVASHIDSAKLRRIQHSALKCTSRGSRLRFQTCAQLVTDKYSLCPSVPPAVCLFVCMPAGSNLWTLFHVVCLISVSTYVPYGWSAGLLLN